MSTVEAKKLEDFLREIRGHSELFLIVSRSSAGEWAATVFKDQRPVGICAAETLKGVFDEVQELAECLAVRN